MTDASDAERDAWVEWRRMDDAPDGEIEDDFAPVDLTVAITQLLVRGETRDEIARRLRISRADVDMRIADATALAEAEALIEREWIVREKLRDLTRQASALDLPTYETTRLSLLLDLAKIELGLISWTRRRAASA
ncbi:MAG: hypothetical protein DI566_13220 [Microbacterium sp.]|nr:MAG: hypothetical protein DI566_13220 [Microbacterium sp.]